MYQLGQVSDCFVLQEKSQETRSKLDSNSEPFADKNLSEGDKANARKLSDALNLNEELCVELLLRTHVEGRPVTVEHAAHIYFDERSNLLQSFIRMLHIRLGYMDTADSACKNLVEQVLQYLTDASKGNSATKTMPMKRLCDIVKVRKPFLESCIAFDAKSFCDCGVEAMALCLLHWHAMVSNHREHANPISPPHMPYIHIPYTIPPL